MALAAAVVVHPAFAATPAGNLLQNPGAEVPAGVISPGAYSTPSGWTAGVPAGTVPESQPYDSCYGGGDTERLLVDTDEASPGGGTRFFFAGQSTPVTLTQEIPVVPADVAGQTLYIGGSFGGFSSQDDGAVLGVQYLNAGGNPIGVPLSTAAVTGADRGGKTGWIPRTANALVPANTAKLRVTLTQTRTDGSDNDAYADDLYVTFDPVAPAKQAAGPVCKTPPPPPVTTPVVTTPPPVQTAPVVPPPVVTPPKPKALAITSVVSGLPSTKRCLSKRAFRIRLKNPGGVKITSARVTVNGKTVATRSGTRVTAPVNLKGLPKGKYTVRITTKLSDGRTVTGTRTYRTCAPKKKR